MATYRRKNGFTMVEIIVVLVILGILCAVALPTMLGMVNETQSKICLTQRSIAQRTLSAYIQANGTSDIDAQIAKSMLDINATKGSLGYEGVCPSKGIYTVDKDNLVINCTLHDNITIAPSMNSASSVINMFQSQSLKSFFANSKNTILDSTGENYGLPAKAQIAEQFGIDPNSYDFKVINKGTSGYYVYISESLTGKSNGDTVSVTGYIYKNGEITKTGSTQTSTVTNRTINGNTYNLITDNVSSTYTWN